MKKLTQLSREQLRKVVGGKRNLNAECGPETDDNRSCTVGNCCSQYGWCGTTEEHCCLSQGCQPDYGTCLDC